MEKNKEELMNNFERAIFFKNEEILPREKARYQWASRFVKKGDRVLEIGCSNGYGTRLLPKGILYTGMDYDEKIIDEANEEYGDQNHIFLHRDINTVRLSDYDVIIAFEVIEHLDNGISIVEELKKHCKTLLVTVPYKEPVGLWGEHHKLHGLDERNFPEFSYDYINEFGDILKRPDTRTFNLMIMRYSKNILASISTRGRTMTTLPMAITSIATQTMKPDRLVIFDDNQEKVDLREIPIYKQLFQMLDYQGIKWEVVFGACKGQHYNHQLANKMGYNFVWRMDDDTVAENNVLEKLYAQINRKDLNVGAVGGAVLVPGDDVQEWQKGENRIEDIKTYNAQWYPVKETKEVEHLHCSFLYRAGIVDYNLGLSRIAHTEETLFTYGFIQEGYKVLITTCTTWHLRNPEGGIRDGQKEMFDHDEQIFLGNIQHGKIIVLNNGMGDHIIFKKLLPDLKKKYPRLTIACCYPQLFEGENVISIAEAKYLLGDIENHNIYKWCAEHAWNEELLLAYEKMLGL